MTSISAVFIMVSAAVIPAETVLYSTIPMALLIFLFLPLLCFDYNELIRNFGNNAVD